MNTTTVIGCIVIAAIVLAIVGGMIRNVKKGKSFCGAELSKPLNTKDVAQIFYELLCEEHYEKHFENKLLKSITLFVFHIEISGKFFNDEHSENKKLIFVTLFVFHFEISGKNAKEEQL